MYGNFKNHLESELKAIDESGLFKRERIITTEQGAVVKVSTGEKVIIFCANNYLGLSSHPKVIEAAHKTLDKHGYGMSSVRFICGTQDIHKALEQKLSEFLGTEDTILYAAAFDANGGVFEPLFDENDAIFVMDNVFVPWEDVFIYRDPARVKTFFPGSGFVHGALFQGCTRYAVKLDFIAGLLAKALRATGGDEARNNQILLGEVIAWRHMFWSLSHAMVNNPQPWRGEHVLPEIGAAMAYRVFGPDSWPRIRACRSIRCRHARPRSHRRSCAGFPQSCPRDSKRRVPARRPGDAATSPTAGPSTTGRVATRAA